MTQLEIVALSIGAFAIFMFGYWLGWRHRGGSHLPRFDADAQCWIFDGPLTGDGVEKFRRSLEARVRRSQR